MRISFINTFYRIDIHAKSRRIASLGVGVAVLSLICVSFAAPVSAEGVSVPQAVQNAETVLRLDDDHVDDTVRVLHAGQSAAIKAGPISITVLVGAEKEKGRRLRTNSPETAVDYTVDQLDDAGLRLAAVIHTDSINTASWDFGPGKIVTVLADGRATVADEAGNFLAGVEAPWCIDAGGVPLGTSYSAAGSVLTQRVDFSIATSFPVVADPQLVTHVGYYEVRLNRAESTAAVGTVAGCTALFSKSPFPAGRALAVGCSVFAAFSTANLAGGKCSTVHVAGFPPAIAAWWPTFPKC